jgi:hypothetical protein
MSQEAEETPADMSSEWCDEGHPVAQSTLREVSVALAEEAGLLLGVSPHDSSGSPLSCRNLWVADQGRECPILSTKWVFSCLKFEFSFQISASRKSLP